MARAICLMILLTFVTCRTGPAQSADGDADIDPLPTVSFLLPAPFALANPAGQFAREQSLRLFSAPVLDPVAIEAMADRYEKRSRELLSERRARIVEYVCGLAPDKRPNALGRLEIRRQQQWNRWLNLQQRYETSLKYRLTENTHGDDAIAQARLMTLLASREAVQALQRERQQLVSESYGQLLETLVNRAPAGPDADVPCDGPVTNRTTNRGPPNQRTENPIHPGQPTEYLYLPYYLALYRFLSLLPPDDRSRLLLALHSGKTSDN